MSGDWCPTSQWHYYAATHSCFYLSTTEAVWSDAYVECQNMGGNLASIDNHAEMSYVYSILSVLLQIRVVHGSIVCDPIQPNPSAD